MGSFSSSRNQGAGQLQQRITGLGNGAGNRSERQIGAEREGRLQPERHVRAYPCGKCTSTDDRRRWTEKLVQADHINRAKFSLNTKICGAPCKGRYLLGVKVPPAKESRTML
jgi:hypothetical protein